MLNVNMHPAITINNQTYRGDLTGKDVFKAICSGFKKRPKLCQWDRMKDALKKAPVYEGIENDSIVSDLLWIGFYIVLGNLVLVGCYKYY